MKACVRIGGVRGPAALSLLLIPLLAVMHLAACQDDFAGPGTELPTSGISGSAITSADGSATVTLGESRIRFNVETEAGEPLAGIAVMASVGTDIVLVGLADPAGSVLPAIAAAQRSTFVSGGANLAGGRSQDGSVTISAGSSGSLMVSAVLSAADLELRAVGLTASQLAEIAGDVALERECDLELLVIDVLDGFAESGILAFADLDIELAYSAGTSSEDVLQLLADSLEVSLADRVEACRFTIGDTQRRMTVFGAFAITAFTGIFANSAPGFTDDTAAALYFLEAGDNGRDLALGAVIDSMLNQVDLLDIAVEAGGLHLIGIRGGSQLVSVGKSGRTVHDRVLRGFTAINGLDVAPNGQIYGSTASGWLVKLDSFQVAGDTAVSVPVGEFGGGLVSSGDIAFTPGSLFATLAEDPTRGTNYLARIDRETGEATVVGDLNFPRVWGLVFSRGTLYGLTAQPGRLIEIDTATATARVIRNLDFHPTGGAGE